jgi:hypothetical protein
MPLKAVFISIGKHSMVQTAPSLGDRGSRMQRMNSVSEREIDTSGVQDRTSSKAIKLSMIRLGNEDVREEAVIRPGFRYAIVKVTNDTMTAHKGRWSWTAQEVATEPWLSAWSVAKQI